MWAMKLLWQRWPNLNIDVSIDKFGKQKTTCQHKINACLMYARASHRCDWHWRRLPGTQLQPWAWNHSPWTLEGKACWVIFATSGINSESQAQAELSLFWHAVLVSVLLLSGHPYIALHITSWKCSQIRVYHSMRSFPQNSGRIPA